MTAIITRSTPVEVEVGGDDGRTVTAYAAVFNVDAEIRDHQGHYKERLHRTTFNKAISDARPTRGRDRWRTNVFFNHGMTLHGTPSELFSQPLGLPQHLEADSTGLLTVTRYAQTPLGDQILQLIREGVVTGQSFTGRIIRSDPERRRYLPSSNGDLPTVTRMELGLSEYGPTPMPAYEDAAIVGVRSTIAALLGSDREALRAFLAATDSDADQDAGGDTGDRPDSEDGTVPDGAAASGTPRPAEEHVTRSNPQDEWLRRYRAALRSRGITSDAQDT